MVSCVVRVGSNYGEERKWLVKRWVKGGWYSTFFFQCHHMSLMDFVVSPPGCGWNVTDLGWDAHEAQLRCPDEVDGDIWIWITMRGLKLLTIQTMVARKNSHGRTGNRTRDLMISSQKLWPLDHEAGLICYVERHKGAVLFLILQAWYKIHVVNCDSLQPEI
jgi:hypothetical protein